MIIEKIEYRKNLVPIAFDESERVIELISRWGMSMAIGAKKKSPKTIDTYMKNIGYLIGWLKNHYVYGHLKADDALTVVTQAGIKQYLAELEAKGLESSTIRNRDITIKVLMDWLTTHEGGRTRASSTHDDKLLSSPPYSKAPIYLDEDQVIQILQFFHNESQRCYAHLMYDVGYRRSELERVLWKDFTGLDGWPDELGYAPVVVRGSKGKGGKIKERISIISKPMIARVLRYHNTLEYRMHGKKWDDSNRPAFLNVHGEPLTYSAIGAALKAASERSGINVSAHDLRHGCAYNIMRSEHGGELSSNLVLIQKQFGHSKVTTTERYTQIPAILLTKLSMNPHEMTWFERSDKIFKNTFLPAKSHKEKRGHSKIRDKTHA